MTEFQNSKKEAASLKEELEEKMKTIESKEQELLQRDSSLEQKTTELAALQEAHDALKNSTTEQIESLTSEIR